MNPGVIAHASLIPDLLSWRESSPLSTHAWTHRLIARRHCFGVTRIGSITGLDRIGIPIAQAVRPLSFSSAVSQGKGLTLLQAAASALMESIESWASQNILDSYSTVSSFHELGLFLRRAFESWLTHDAPSDWDRVPLQWMDGWDLFERRVVPVPAMLVDTVYLSPSPYPAMFPRTSTGLGAGRTFTKAVIQAGLEILERHAIGKAKSISDFFDTRQINIRQFGDGLCANLVAQIMNADLLCALWKAPSEAYFPVYWCHVMEQGPPNELAPLPSEGFGCDFSDERAAVKAILEACQARATAISGAREDITRIFYPTSHDRHHLAEWRSQLSQDLGYVIPATAPLEESSDREILDHLVRTLHQAGALAAIVIPLWSDFDNEIHSVRLLAPPLTLNPRG
jgi:ribosomal protein S12 methylthiotransferase accessory factor